LHVIRNLQRALLCHGYESDMLFSGTKHRAIIPVLFLLLYSS